MALFDNEHAGVPLGKNHRVHDLEFADATARAAHVFVADDVGKEYRDLDTNTWWRLVSQAAGVGTFRESAAAGGGATGEVEVFIAFTFGTASPLAIFTTPATPLIIHTVRVVMLTQFDVEPTVFSVGTVGTPDELFSLADLDIRGDLSEASKPKQYSSATAIQLTLTPGVGTTAGNGIIILSIKG